MAFRCSLILMEIKRKIRSLGKAVITQFLLAAVLLAEHVAIPSSPNLAVSLCKTQLFVWGILRAGFAKVN